MSRLLRYPVLHHCLKFVKEITPSAFEQILDVGVQHGTIFLMDIFPESHHHLFEPVASYHNKINEYYTNRGIDYTLHDLALTNVTKELYLHQYSSDGSGNITHSEVREDKVSTSAHLHSFLEIKGVKLDEIKFSPPLVPLHYLIKLDVDGIEELIIEGGSTLMGGASFVVLEASVVRGNVLRRLQIMDDLGFRLFDICDNAYYYNQLSCLDLVFINEKLRATDIHYRPWEYAQHKVKWEKWQHGYPDLAKEPLPKAFD